jgi:hypothetical protein
MDILPMTLVKATPASRETDRAPPRPATLILGLTVALFLVLLLFRPLV